MPAAGPSEPSIRLRWGVVRTVDAERRGALEITVDVGSSASTAVAS